MGHLTLIRSEATVRSSSSIVSAAAAAAAPPRVLGTEASSDSFANHVEA